MMRIIWYILGRSYQARAVRAYRKWGRLSALADACFIRARR